MKKVKGFGAVEYLVGLFVLVTLFLMPYSDKVSGESRNVLQMLTAGVKQDHASYLYAQSLSHLQTDLPLISAQHQAAQPLPAKMKPLTVSE
ncbi:hypothetical protein SAMN05660691_01607 [Rheinheimera pacifica]|uniref:Uncharacterized protein n=1 Tax=Rheinheimera pacifica TaxID=173990 RepID=A0A1H6L9C6_9GAMM|nr:hypothetical protein [Rheinheimera pacifica]SEH81060.1 hypothetical protein SAMN05660691_01607 [Rheinheimera pacifica]